MQRSEQPAWQGVGGTESPMGWSGSDGFPPMCQVMGLSLIRDEKCRTDQGVLSILLPEASGADSSVQVFRATPGQSQSLPSAG